MLSYNNMGQLRFDDQWRPGLRTIRKLLGRENVSKGEWHDLFATNNRITSWVENGSNELLRALEDELKLHVITAAKRIHANKGDNDLLRCYVQEWSNFSVLIEYLPNPFAFIERGVQRNPTGISRTDGRHAETLFVVRNIMYGLWNSHVFDTIHPRLLTAAMDIVERERVGEGVESSLVVGVRKSFVNHGHGKEEPYEMYQSFFERAYLEKCTAFYNARTQQIMADNGILNYMAYAHEKLTEEETRGKRYLDEGIDDSFSKLVRALVDSLVLQYKDQLLAEAPKLISTNDTRRLEMLYVLMNKTNDGIAPLQGFLSKHIKQEGLDTMRENAATIVNDSEKYVEQLLDMYTKFTTLVTDAFRNDTRFLTVRDQAFQEVVNNTEVFKFELTNTKSKGKNASVPESKCPELLALYCDLLLRKSGISKKLSSDEIDDKLNNVLLVLKYVANKDVFMRYHKQHLSRRLILESSADQEKEELLVNKLRDNGMPSDYVSKLYRMLQDIELNKELSTEFRRYAADNGSGNVADAIHLKVLNAGAWTPGNDKCRVSFPQDIEEIIPAMEDFYKQKHTGRKLSWAHNWSSGVVTFALGKREYQLEVSAFQMAVLFVYNSRRDEKITLEGLRLATELPNIDLIRTLMTLLMNPKVKQQILFTDCQPINPKNFNESTQFWINQDFSIMKGDKPMTRGRVVLVNRLFTSQENADDGAHDEILRLRELRIQEAIVKIMKTRRVMKQNPLHNETVEMLRNMFVPTRRLIKQQIEWLIEQKFLRRDTDDYEQFVYVT